MFPTTTAETQATDWRQWDDRDARQDRVAADLAAAIAEPGF
jgi:hypothetical protein